MIKELLKGGSLLELGAGNARNMRGVYKNFGIKNMHLVDSHAKSLEGLDKIDNVQTSAQDVNEWIKTNVDREFTVLLGVWILSYINEKEINQILGWAKQNVEYLIFVEPVHILKTKREMKQEFVLNPELQMIGRHETAYLTLFTGFGFEVMDTGIFTHPKDGEVGTTTHYFILKSKSAKEGTDLIKGKNDE